MKKLGLLIGLVFLLVLPGVLAINIDVEKQTITEAVIIGLDEPAVFELNVTNNGNEDSFEIYNLFGWNMEPKEFPVGGGDTEKITLKVYPRQDTKIRNFYTIPYFIRAGDDSEVEEKVTVKIMDLKDMFEIGSTSFDPESSSLQIYVYNKESFNFKDLKMLFSSKFFEKEEMFDLNKYEKKEFTISINKEDINTLTAGFYTLNANVSIAGISAEIFGTIKFSEKTIVETVRKDYGLIVSTKIIEQSNGGNTVQKADVSLKKNIISRLFTSFSPAPDVAERKGGMVYYSWTRDLKPGEKLEVIVKTNWLYPFLVILLIVVIVFLVKQISNTDVVVKKRVSFVKAKGGEFALRVSLFIQAKKYVERVSIIERLPSLMKLYERFSGQAPNKINENARTLEWNFEKLEEGEIRTLSYIMYSKSVGVMGKFALPPAVAIYQKEGEIKDVESNKAYFVAEQRTKSEVY